MLAYLTRRGALRMGPGWQPGRAGARPGPRRLRRLRPGPPVLMLAGNIYRGYLQ